MGPGRQDLPSGTAGEETGLPVAPHPKLVPAVFVDTNLYYVSIKSLSSMSILLIMSPFSLSYMMSGFLA